MKYTDDNGLINSTRKEELMLREALAEYGSIKKQGEYTIEDYYALPDEPRVELIDGVFYAMGAPTVRHQYILFELAVRFREHIKEKGGKCRALIAPCDVQLDCDDKTMVRPDVMVVCDRDKLSNL
ncbi:MAG: Uma2 family endonuclease, partial [Clostridiales bacterium]|nr:Uma2 family endonuclease [Clostridiales bacterium]